MAVAASDIAGPIVCWREGTGLLLLLLRVSAEGTSYQAAAGPAVAEWAAFQGYLEIVAVVTASFPAVVSHVPLLCADGAEVQGNVAEVDPVWSVCRIVALDGARHVKVAFSSCSTSSTSSSSASFSSAVAEGVDLIARAVAGSHR